MPLERPIGLVVQTTQNRQLLEAVVAALKERGANVEVCDTICEATSERQQAARELAARANTMVVIGGRNSANTTRLAEICAAHTATHHIEDAQELDPAWFSGAELIGITAGASTPSSQIKQVVETVAQMTGAQEVETESQVSGT